jgi:hypothetical protein
MYGSVNDRIQVQTQNRIQSDIPFGEGKQGLIRAYECGNCFHFSSDYSVCKQVPELSELFPIPEREKKYSEISNCKFEISNFKLQN